jgi:hypothetical protein
MSVNFNINFISVFQNVNLLWEVYITRDISNLHSTFKALASNSRHLSRTGSFVDGAVMSTGEYSGILNINQGVGVFLA